MNYKELGSTGLKVSMVAFGGIAIQKITCEESADIIHKAEELGMNFIDTARLYTVSEEYVGYALEGRRDKWIIATKSMARDKNSMMEEANRSFKNLRTDYIDLYQFHNVKTVEDYEKILSEDGAYKALEELKSKGKIGHIGITSHSLDVLKVAIESGKFETIMYPYNIVERQGKELFQRAKELNIGVIDMKPMAGGALNNGTLALKYVLSNKNITTAIPGMANLEEVVENSACGNKDIVLTEQEKIECDKILKELGTEFCRRCGYCAPCTKNIDIPGIFVLEAYKIRYGLPEWADDRYFSLDSRAKDCIECGACEKRCPYDLPIIKMLKRVRTEFEE
ncbi:aldo/keto reductase [Clostridium sp. Marseille-Q2269]|uniref:aldo/keto reductase n=1 Tax=Clostridium sp. Marseille-Q2269 TaxID=2942205 RepID=UPI002073EAFE|nr:aldo/keto reductase [Clostridium sp. Marseille-Q2269]